MMPRWFPWLAFSVMLIGVLGLAYNPGREENESVENGSKSVSEHEKASSDGSRGDDSPRDPARAGTGRNNDPRRDSRSNNDVRRDRVDLVSHLDDIPQQRRRSENAGGSGGSGRDNPPAGDRGNYSGEPGKQGPGVTPSPTKPRDTKPREQENKPPAAEDSPQKEKEPSRRPVYAISADVGPLSVGILETPRPIVGVELLKQERGDDSND